MWRLRKRKVDDSHSADHRARTAVSEPVATAFTPGPWGIERTLEDNWIGSLRPDGKIEHIVVGNDRFGLREDVLARHDADAHLIAAAPELYAVAQLGLELSMCAASIQWDHRARNTAEWLEGLRRRIEEFQPKAYAALTKAEGRS